MTPTPADAAAFATYAATLHERARLSRESAILAIAGGYLMMLPDVGVVEAASDQMEDPTGDLAERLMRRRRA